MDKPTLLLTRPHASAQAFAAALDPALLAEVRLCVSPLLRIVDLGVQPDVAGYAGVIFTSVHGVNFGPKGRGQRAYCVGAGTAKAAEDRGWQLCRVAETAQELIKGFYAHPQEGDFLHLSGTYRRGDIAEHLTEFGIKTDVVVIYDQRLCPLSPEAQQVLGGEEEVILPLFSARTARQFADQVHSFRHVRGVAISQAVAQEVEHLPFSTLLVAQAPTLVEMRRSVEKQLREVT